MTLSTSAVAVCCSKDSLSSLSSRAFSIAITAWSAKVVSSSICLLVNGRTERRARSEYPDWRPFTQQWCADHGTITAEFLCHAKLVFRVGLRVDNLYRRALEQSSTSHGAAPGFEWYALQLILQLGRPAEVRLRTGRALARWTSRCVRCPPRKAGPPIRPACSARFAGRRSSG